MQDKIKKITKINSISDYASEMTQYTWMHEWYNSNNNNFAYA